MNHKYLFAEISAAQKAVLIASAAVFSVMSIGCDKGSNRPVNWQDSQILQARCKSERAFSLDKSANQVKKNSIASIQPMLSDRFELRTRFFLMDVNGKKLDSKTASLEKIDATDAKSVAKEIVIEKDCDALKATYAGPLFDTGDTLEVSGSLTEISSKSITIDGFDKKSKARVIVKATKRTSAIPENASFQDVLALAAKGEIELDGLDVEIAIENADGKGQKVMMIRQETAVQSRPLSVVDESSETASDTAPAAGETPAASQPVAPQENPEEVVEAPQAPVAESNPEAAPAPETGS